MNLFVDTSVENRILIEVLKPGMEILNPDLYKKLVMLGGAAAIRVEDLNINSPEVDYQDTEIMLLQEMLDTLTEDEIRAVKAHESAHITNGDVSGEIPASGIKSINNAEFEIKADEAGAYATSAATMLSAIDKMNEFQVRKLFKVTSPFWVKFWTFLNKSKIYRARRKALLKLMAQGM